MKEGTAFTVPQKEEEKSLPEKSSGFLKEGEAGSGEETGKDIFSSLLLRWFSLHGRDLPWREEPSPYHVWLSEVMLQQTRVEAVKGYYRRFLSSLPDIPALAAAEEELVLKLWEGLGYYSRARNLQKGARLLVSQYGGKLPESAEELRRIPGIGDYTAAAIASIAFKERIPAVDGNLLRIFSRLTACGSSMKSSEAKERARLYFLERMPDPPAKELVSEARARYGFLHDSRDFSDPGNFNQALMDLGSSVCLPNGTPRCALCPLNQLCAAHRLSREEDFPVREEKKPRKIEKLTVFLLRRGGKSALRRRPGRGLLAGLYEFPNRKGHLSEEEALSSMKELGLRPLHIRSLPAARHIFTHREWDMIGYEIRLDEFSPEQDSLIFYENEEIEKKLSIPSAFSAFLKEL